MSDEKPAPFAERKALQVCGNCYWWTSFQDGEKVGLCEEGSCGGNSARFIENRCSKWEPLLPCSECGEDTENRGFCDYCDKKKLCWACCDEHGCVGRNR